MVVEEASLCGVAATGNRGSKCLSITTRSVEWITTVCTLALLLLAALTVSGARASTNAADRVEMPKVAKPPPAGTDFLKGEWLSALRATTFASFTSERPSRFPTIALLMYDNKNIYVGFICDQRGAASTSTQSVNDVGYGLDDEVTISIDTSGNNSRTYAFTSTSRGVRYEYSSESSRYQPPWTSVATMTPAGYRVMMTIPIADMKVAGGASTSWRVNFSRWIPAIGDLSTWAYGMGSQAYCASRNQATTYCDATRWPLLTNIHLAGISAAPPPYADVYVLGDAGRDRRIFETSPLTFTDQRARNFGVDSTIPFTRTLSFVAALGPDFSNVETDQTTIAPQEFARKYTEYRPFFAQGASFINAVPRINTNTASNQIFYTPSFGVLDDGFKIEGTVGNQSLGVLDAKGDGYNDQAVGFSSRKSDGTLSFSFQGVNANHPGANDRTVGVGISTQNLHSGFNPIVTYQQETGTGIDSPRLAHELLVGEVTSHGLWQTGLLYRDIAPEYSPLDGYTGINDIRGAQAFATYNGIGTERGAIKSYQIGLLGDRYLDRSGSPHQVDLNESASILLKNLVGFSVTGDTSELRTYRQAYPVYLDTQFAAFNQTSLALNYRDGTPSPTDISYSFGKFAVACSGGPSDPLPCATAVNYYSPAYTQLLDASTTRAFRAGLAVTVEYAGTTERPLSGPSDSQWLRRLTITRAFGSEGEFALSLREISGTGGYAKPGEDLAVSYHQRFVNQNQLYFEYGSPASYTTLQRFIVKYVVHVGSGGNGT